VVKGDKIKNDFYEYKDPYTAALVTRLTDPTQLNHHQYFYYKMITNDGRYLIYSHADKDNKRNLYKMDLTDGWAVQLTDCEHVSDYNGQLSKDDKYLYYDCNGKFLRMDMATLEDEIYYESPKGWATGGNPGLSSDEKYAVIVEMAEEDSIHKSNGWGTFETQWAKKPRCRIVYIDIENKTSHIVIEQNCWLGHPQIRPNDNHTIMYCHEGPPRCIDARLWLINSDGTNERCAHEQPKGIIITHEFWKADGSELGFVYRGQNNIPKETIRYVNPDTLEENILMECSTLAHFINDVQDIYGVGDSQQKEKIEGQVDDNFICLLDIKNRVEKRVCYHGSSWRADYGNSQDSHPHPAFSPDGKTVVFTSDKDGMPAIYKVKIV
jgi:oligogalacturonide lyase